MRFFLIITILLCHQTAFSCTKDTDCKGDRICVFKDSQQGQCQAPDSDKSWHGYDTPSLSVSDVSSVPSQQSAQNESLQNFHLNLLGLLQFGLTPSIEWGSDTTFLLRARLLNTGLLSYIVAAADGGELAFGIGTSFQVRKYLSKRTQQGPYLGAGLELMYTNNESDKNYETYFVVPQVEGGFRWLSEGYFTGFGIFAGTAIPVKTIGYTEGENLITGGLIWDMGWYF